MTIKSIGYSRTFNLGNYESVKVDLVADLTEAEQAEFAQGTPDQIQISLNEKLDELAIQAKAWVEKRFGPRLSDNKRN